MKNAKVKEIVVPAVSLFLICAAVTALLALTNQVTENFTACNRNRKQNKK